MKKYEKELLDTYLEIILAHIEERPEIAITYFVPDPYKDGGEYREAVFKVKRIDQVNRIVISEDNDKYDLDSIIDIRSGIIDEVLNREETI